MFGEVADWKPGLEHYLGSAAEDGRLNALGAKNAHSTAVGRLRARAAIDTYLREHPDLEQRPLPAPIIITGGWRTGTTFLFRLLGRDSRLRAPLPAELGAPWLLAGDLKPQQRAERLAAAASGHQMLHILNPAMAAVHDSGPDLAEECVLAMGTTLRNWGFTATTRWTGTPAGWPGSRLPRNTVSTGASCESSMPTTDDDGSSRRRHIPRSSNISSRPIPVPA